jgi:hypothetical protein
MSDFKTSYAEMLATLATDIEALLDEYSDRETLSPSACEIMWSKFEALRARLAALKARVSEALRDDPGPDGHETAIRMFLAELECLLDVEHDGDDWEAYVGAAMIHAEQRICDEARWVAHWS